MKNVKEILATLGIAALVTMYVASDGKVIEGLYQNQDSVNEAVKTETPQNSFKHANLLDDPLFEDLLESHDYTRLPGESLTQIAWKHGLRTNFQVNTFIKAAQYLTPLIRPNENNDNILSIDGKLVPGSDGLTDDLGDKIVNGEIVNGIKVIRIPNEYMMNYKNEKKHAQDLKEVYKQ